MPGPRSALAALALLVPLAAAGCAHSPWNPYGGWKAVRSKHITLYTHTKYLYKNALDGLELSYTALWASLFKTRSVAPVEVLFVESEEFEPLFGLYRQAVTVGKLPGRGQLGRRGMVVMNQSGSDPMSRAAHQLAHLFVHANAPLAPLWFHEAYATYVETIQYRADDKSQVACLGHLNPEGPTVTLEELFSWTWSRYDDSKKKEWYGNAARTLLDYFLMAEGGGLREAFGELAIRVVSGEETRKALAAVFPDLTIAELEKRMMDHRRSSETGPDSGVARRGLCPREYPIPNDRAADRGDPRIEPLDPADIERVFLRLRLLPRRAGYVDWYPPEVITLEGLVKN